MEANAAVITALREERGWTQVKLAAQAGISKQVLHKIEIGQTSRPRAHTIAAIARALGVPVRELVKGDFDDDPLGRRRTVANLYRLGLSPKQIAKHLGVTPYRVKSDIKSLVG